MNMKNGGQFTRHVLAEGRYSAGVLGQQQDSATVLESYASTKRNASIRVQLYLMQLGVANSVTSPQPQHYNEIRNCRFRFLISEGGFYSKL